MLLQVLCILLLDISLVEELIGACFASWREDLWRGLQTRSIFLSPREKNGKLEKGASVRGCIVRVVGMCGVCLLLGLGVHGLGLLVCLPLGPVVLVSCGGSIKQSSPYQVVSQGS